MRETEEGRRIFDEENENERIELTELLKGCLEEEGYIIEDYNKDVSHRRFLAVRSKNGKVFNVSFAVGKGDKTNRYENKLILRGEE